jgi:hypothetical protein
MKGITELEGLGVVWAVKHFRPYLYGHLCGIEVTTQHPTTVCLLGYGYPEIGNQDSPPLGPSQ